jgi:hypothetical protein
MTTILVINSIIYLKIFTSEMYYLLTYYHLPTYLVNVLPNYLLTYLSTHL